MSSNLVTVHNQEENVYIQHRHNGERSWIGLNDRSVEGSFVWTNKEISSFRFWAPQQPNDWKNEDCVHTLGAKHGYTWNDLPCHNCYNYTCFKGTRHSKIYIYVIVMSQTVLLDTFKTGFKKVVAHTVCHLTQKKKKRKEKKKKTKQIACKVTTPITLTKGGTLCIGNIGDYHLHLHKKIMSIYRKMAAKPRKRYHKLIQRNIGNRIYIPPFGPGKRSVGVRQIFSTGTTGKVVLTLA